MKFKTAIATCALSLTVMAPCVATAAKADPCQSADVEKLSAPISVSGSGNQQLVAAGAAIHVCGFAIAPGSGAFFEFTYGTGPCGQGVETALTGTMYAGGSNPNAPFSYSGPGTIFSVPAGNELCIGGGGALGLAGVLTYTQ
jgi:hypothetical protein